MVDNILNHLKLKRSPPTIEYLKDLMNAYCSHVPWESVSKIVRKKSCGEISKYLRLENEFWTSAIQYGTGGTCYESNWAFFCFLKDLGFEAYLTINQIKDKSSVHAAMVVILDDKKYIVDIGYPTYAPILINEEAATVTKSAQINYRCTPVSAKEFIIENFPHPKPYLYHLTDNPVDPEAYLKIAMEDYSEKGLYSERIVIRKLVNGVPTRFDSDDIPYNIHLLQNGEKIKTIIKEGDLIERLSMHFSIHSKILSQAFAINEKVHK